VPLRAGRRRKRALDHLRDMLIAAGKIAAFRDTTGTEGRPAEWWVLQ
jgi:hypothetical protein